MQHREKKWALVLCLLAFCAGAFAQSIAPLNPAFRDYMKQARRGTLVATTADGHGLGYVPAPWDKSHLKGTPAALSFAAAPPASYDLRNYGKVSSVQDQGSYGNCWTFATYGSMESCLLPAESWDFSENNLANLHGFDSRYGEGGDYPMSCAYLARWSGPVNEVDDPYSNGPYSPSGCTVQKHVQSVWFIPDQTSATDTEITKQLIMTYGAIYAVFCYDDTCYHNGYYSHYNPSTNYANHAITVIGWDDNFSRNKFRTPAPADGAWLCKNSWGTDWGDNGFFWISYYEHLIGTGRAIFLNAEPVSNYASLWSYDTLGFCTAIGYENSIGWGANIFSASSGGTLQAVSFYLTGGGASYEVRVYTGVSAGNPVSGTLAATKTGSQTYAGYYTVALDSPVSLPAGNFSVVVKFNTPGFSYPIPIEYRIPGYSSAAFARAGESYVSADGSSWDAASYEGTYFNVCIKGFGTGGGGPTPPPAQQAVLNDYNGDGLSEAVVYNAYTGDWYAYFLPYDALGTDTWGYYGALPVPGDYDGDGYADLVVYDYGSGVWWLNCTTWGAGAVSWGGPGFVPAPADYDSDGRTDLVVYNMYNGVWYAYFPASGSYGVASWGYYGTIPVPGDYDGDRCADLVVYDYGSGFWWLNCTTAGQAPVQWGGLGYIPAPGDYNANGRTDLLVYNFYTGDWFGYSLGFGYIGQANWGYYGALPVPGDYDGDGYADLVVYDSAYYWPGYWFFNLSVGISGYLPMGGPGYLPVKTTIW